MMLRKLATRALLSDADRRAIRNLPYFERAYMPSSYVLREGELARPRCSFVVDGLAYRQKLTTDGSRQIVSIHMTGDFLDLQHLFLAVADHNVQALTKLTVAEIEKEALQALALDHPGVGRALWIDALIDGSIYREWIMNVGRRDAKTRVAHLLCEFAMRMEAAGIASDGGYHLPMTQEQLGDAVGLTPVHVNRMLKALAGEGLIARQGRFISVPSWERIRDAADFSPAYLHLDQVAPLEG